MGLYKSALKAASLYSPYYDDDISRLGDIGEEVIRPYKRQAILRSKVHCIPTSASCKFGLIFHSIVGNCSTSQWLLEKQES